MTTGHVNSRREAIVSIRLAGTDGIKVTIEAVLDTGFSDFLTLPLPLVVELGLQRQDTVVIRLGDGTLKRVDQYEGKLWWNGDWMHIPIQESNSDPLLGMGVLYDHLLNVEGVEGGEVTVELLD